MPVYPRTTLTDKSVMNMSKTCAFGKDPNTKIACAFWSRNFIALIVEMSVAVNSVEFHACPVLLSAFDNFAWNNLERGIQKYLDWFCMWWYTPD